LDPVPALLHPLLRAAPVEVVLRLVQPAQAAAQHLLPVGSRRVLREEHAIGAADQLPGPPVAHPAVQEVERLLPARRVAALTVADATATQAHAVIEPPCAALAAAHLRAEHSSLASHVLPPVGGFASSTCCASAIRPCTSCRAP